MRDLGRPAILKSARFGYDGKGQVRIDADTDLDEAWRRMGGAVGILEGFVDFAIEASVIVARGLEGQMASCSGREPAPQPHSRHHDRPGAGLAGGGDAGRAIARHTAEELKLVGLLAVEMFVTPGGEVLVNELAPRPHNSGHWTMDACVTDQFEQFIRAVAGSAVGLAERAFGRGDEKPPGR